MSETLTPPPPPLPSAAHSRFRRWFRRARTTPMRDWMRGRLTGRLDLDARLAAADLPPDAAALVRTTVKKTRLWRLEKAQVADELIAHFHDGLAADTPPDQLVADFGDPKPTAQLIRRAKKRGRPLVAKMFIWTRRAALAAVAFYVVVVVRFYFGSPTVSVDYLARINGKIAAVPEADQAWPIYREMLEKEQWSWAWEARTSEGVPLWEVLYNPLVRPGHEDWPQVASFLDQLQPTLDTLRRGGQRAGLGYQPQREADISEADHRAFNFTSDPPATNQTAAETLFRESMISVLLPHLGFMRQSVRLLAADTRAAVYQNDPPRAIANLTATLGLARQSAESPFLISGLVAISIVNVHCESVMRILTDTPAFFTDAQWSRLAHELAVVAPRDLLQVESEKIVLRDLIQRMYTDNGRGNGHITDEGLELLEWLRNEQQTESSIFALMGEETVGSRASQFVAEALLPGSALLIADRRATAQRLDELFALAERDIAKPLGESGHDSMDTEIESWSTFERQRYPLLFETMPAMGAAARTAVQSQTRCDGVLIGIALELYRREHGAWPSALEELVPRFIPALPVDPITGGALRYRAAETGPVVYSVGGDRDDDGGRSPYDQETQQTRNHWAAYWDKRDADDPGRDGDWVMFPWSSE